MHRRIRRAAARRHAGTVDRFLSRRRMPRRRRHRRDGRAVRRRRFVREGRVIALAGVMQALALVRSIALRGSCDFVLMRASLASTLRIDAESPEAVYGGVTNLKLGLETLMSQFERGSK